MPALHRRSAAVTRPVRRAHLLALNPPTGAFSPGCPASVRAQLWHAPAVAGVVQCRRSRVLDPRERVAELYRTYGPAIYRRCLRLVGDTEAARDATQEVFGKLMRDAR